MGRTPTRYYNSLNALSDALSETLSDTLTDEEVEFDQEFFKQFVNPVPIPDLLHSAYEEGPFRTCMVCGGELTDGRLYEIQKVYRGKEPVFEVAICHGCGEDASKEFSEQSIESFKKFLVDHFRPSTEPHHCHFCGFPRSLIPHFTIVGACKESSLILPSIIMCESCTELLQERLSSKTRDAQEEFVSDNFPGVPADLDLSPSFSGLLG